MPQKFKFEATDSFWESFYALSSTQKQRVREVWEIFKENPFDPRLGTHKINRLSALRGRTVRSVVIEGNLRAAFEIIDDRVITFSMGTHDIYK